MRSDPGTSGHAWNWKTSLVLSIHVSSLDGGFSHTLAPPRVLYKKGQNGIIIWLGLIFDPVLAVFYKKTRKVVGQSDNYMGYGNAASDYLLW